MIGTAYPITKKKKIRVHYSEYLIGEKIVEIDENLAGKKAIEISSNI